MPTITPHQIEQIKAKPKDELKINEVVLLLELRVEELERWIEALEVKQ